MGKLRGGYPPPLVGVPPIPFTFRLLMFPQAITQLLHGRTKGIITIVK